MPLHPQAQKLLDVAKAAGLPPLHKVSVTEARARMAAAFTTRGEPEPVCAVKDLQIVASAGEIPARVYRPAVDDSLPAVIFFHGGGWVLNSIATHDALCRALANLSGCAIISLDYRLAPEHKFPAAIEDAWFATRWVAAHAAELGVDFQRLAVAGDSSGGTLAAAVTILARSHRDPVLACQVLIYPVTDHWNTGTASYQENATGYSLYKDLMVWFWNHYLPVNADLSDPRLCPLRAKDFTALPPALVLTAEYDPLRDEGESYAQRLRAAGVSVEAERYLGMMHGFLIQFPNLDDGRRGLDHIAAFLRRHLHPASTPAIQCRT